MVSTLASGARGQIPARGEEKFWCPNTLSLVTLAGITLNKCIVLQLGALTGCCLCRESRLLCRLKNPTIIKIWLLVGFFPYKIHLPIM